MALARLALKNLQQQGRTLLVPPPPSSAAIPFFATQKQRWSSQLLRRLSSEAEEKRDTSSEVAITHEGSKKSKQLFPRRKNRGSLWRRRNNRDYSIPALWEFFPSGLGNALIQATENINKLMENLSPSHLMGRAKEQDDCYKLRYHVPGLSKEDVKITVEDGVLSIKGEHKEDEEEEGSDDDEFWSSKSFYGYYNTSVLLPDDAKTDEIKAEMKDGVLNIVVPKSEKVKKDVKEIQVQ